jgi:branched-subunit amino acid transport protein
MNANGFRDGVKGALPIVLGYLPVGIFAWKVKSLWGSVLLGMAVYWLLGFFL